MKYIELQYAFELEAANIDKILTEKISSDDISYWLNQGVYKFIKTRYNGNNISRTSFEQDEKRTRDLINLRTSAKLVGITQSNLSDQYTEFNYVYPKDVMFVIDEQVTIIAILPDGSIKEKHTELFECTSDNYMYRITNTLTDFHLRNGYARPLRIMTETGCKIFTDTTYDIGSYTVVYLRNPQQITMNKPFDEYTEFPEYVHSEIVKLSVQMYLENATNQRYQSIANEVNTME